MKSFGFSGIAGHPWSSILGIGYGIIMAGLVQQGIISTATAGVISTIVTTLAALLFKGANPPPKVGP